MRILVVSELAEQVISPAHRVLEARGVGVKRLALGTIRRRSRSRTVDHVRRYLPGRDVLAAIGDAARGYEPDVIHIGTGRAVALAVLRATGRRRTTPLMFDHGSIGSLNVLSPIDHAIYFSRRMSRIVVPSSAVINNWMGNTALAMLVSAARCDVLHHPVVIPDAAGVLPREDIRSRLGLEPDDFVVGTVCSIRPIKNLPFVARVVREVGGNAVLAVVGNQGDSTEVRRIRAAGDDRVRLIGPVPDARTIMGAFDVYVTPTRRPGESFGIAPAEAMAQGVPVVTMNVGGTAEIVEHGVSGFALPAVAADWRHTIRMLQSDPARLARYGAAARDRIKTRFSPEAIADDCLDLYRRAVAAAR